MILASLLVRYNKLYEYILIQVLMIYFALLKKIVYFLDNVNR